MDYARSRRYALYRLSRMSYFSGDLRGLLIRKGATEEVAQQVVSELVELGYIDDTTWVASFVRRRQFARDGARKIGQELRQRRVPENLIKEHLPSPNEEGEAIEALLATRYKARDLSDYKERTKVQAALARKGFSYDAINNALANQAKGEPSDDFAAPESEWAE